MAGTNTLLLDNPKLNVRQWHGNQPIRILLDKNCSLPKSLHAFDQTQKTWVFNTVKDELSGQTQWINIPFDNHLLDSVLSFLYAQNVLSLFVEGGRMLLQSFIDAGLWDEARVFVGKGHFGQGVPAPLLPACNSETIQFGEELLHIYTA